MALVGYVSSSPGDTASLEIIAALTEYGHTVTTSTQAGFGAATFSAQDAIVAAQNDRDDSTFISNLDTHMDTHGVPVICMRPIISAGVIGRNASDEPDTPASALGIIALERRTSTSGRPDPLVTRSESNQNYSTSGLGVGRSASDTIMISEGGGDTWSEIPEVTMADGTVIEVVSNAAGTRLMNNVDGFTSMVVAEAADAKVGARTGETFGTRVAWIGIGGDDRIGKEGAGILHALVIWAQDNAAANDYPTSGTNGALLVAIDLSQLDVYETGSIDWTETTPAGTSLSVLVSDDFGATYSVQTKGAAVAVLSDGEDVSNKVLLIKIIVGSTDVAETPILQDLIVVLRGEDPPLQDLDTTGVQQGTIAPTGFFTGGQVIWTTGNNAGLAMEVKEWTSGTRVIRLFLPMPLDIAVGDAFEIRPGCQKRLLEDCVAKFANAINFRAFPHIVGTDQITRIPDAQG